MPRKPAPPISVIDPFVDDRASILNEIAEKDKGFVYSWQRAGVGSERLIRLGQEVVKDSEGKVVTHGVGGDVLVKTPRELFKARREVESKRSYSIVSNLVKDRNSITKKAQPKTPSRTKIEDDEAEE
jgi:hypothetical protein